MLVVASNLLGLE